MMAAKKKAGRKKKISLTEFRAWLEGVEELQPDDWGPDTSQWQLIREKIDCIIADAPVQQVAATVATAAAQPMRMQPGFQQAGIAPPPPVPAPVLPLDANGQPVQIPLAGNPAPPTNPLLASQGKAAIKTPDMDSSDGSFKSTFD